MCDTALTLFPAQRLGSSFAHSDPSCLLSEVDLIQTFKRVRDQAFIGNTIATDAREEVY